jgi:prevent-host-death family protein
MKMVNVHEAKSTLSSLLAEVEEGEEVVIARNGKPIAKLSRVEPVPRREAGILRRLPELRDFKYDPSVFAPLSDDKLEREGWPG